MNIQNGDEIDVLIANNKFYYVDGSGQFKLLGYQIPQTEGNNGQTLVYNSTTDTMEWGNVGGGANVQSGTFTRAAEDGSGTESISVSGTPKMIFIDCYANNSSFSNGKSDGTFNTCIRLTAAGAFSYRQSHCLSILDSSNNGYTGVIEITESGFDVNFTVVANGEPITCIWFAIYS